MKKLKAMLLSLGIMTVVSAALLALAALVLGKMETLPKGAVPVVTTVIGCAAVFLGAFFASLYLKEKGIVNGLVSAFLFSAVLLMISFFAFEAELGISGAAKFIAVFISGILGGILGVNRKSRVKF